MDHDLDVNHIIKSIRSVKYILKELLKNDDSLSKKMVLNSKAIINLNTDAKDESSCDHDVQEQSNINLEKQKS